MLCPKSQIRNAVIFCGLMTLGFNLLSAATLCVNPSGASGCYATIGAAVSAAKANDRINVAPGQYAEAVIVTKALQLIGAGPQATIINARGLANGVYVDGLDNGGLSELQSRGGPRDPPPQRAECRARRSPDSLSITYR